jgi:aldehyde:ferredoxin oxidoreductase
MGTLFGWAGKILRANLTDGSVSHLPTMDYAPRFIGGQGIASRMYWEGMNNNIRAFDADNHLYIMNGPLCGTRAPAASRWVIAGKSPMAFPEQYACGNLGGRLGAALKWAGLDGLDIVGAAKNPTIMVIESGGKYSFQDASALWGKNTFETISSLQETFGKEASVATIGEAGERRVRFANVIGSGGVSATKGFGAVMGSKNLKAIVVKAPKVSLPLARPELFQKTNDEITSLWKGESSGRYWFELDIMLQDITKIKSTYCYGCPGTCRRGIYRTDKGEEGHRMSCFSAYFYAPAERAKTGETGEASFHATQLANKHGICVMELLFLVKWLPQALREGTVDPVETGLAPDGVGTSGWIETLVNLIISRKGFGDLLAEGSRRAAQELRVAELLDGVVSKTGFATSDHDARLYPSTVPIHATEPTYPITQFHEVVMPMLKWMQWMGTDGMMGFLTTEKLRNVARLFWGDVKAAEFDSPEKMGEAAARMQNRAYAKENFILCDWFWPIHFSGNSDSGAGDPTLEARLFSAVTGEDMDEDGFLRLGERCANLCRAIYLREGRRGRVDDVLEGFNYSRPLSEPPAHYAIFNPDNKLPGKDGSIFSRTGATIKRDFFEQIMDDYYKARDWDSETGLFSKEGLNSLDLADLIPELKTEGFVKETG